ncbi:short-chain dehydrogenase [Kordiimonas sediminis]|uniref:Short-chain dehydrogenase n=1 Tax=Kordiimonas sediminis TaxID=1735581 RepID=A0A919AYX8_9PROT|nr:SDR family NAD(P)-dependent oxidoreductase [Kordiimonas sediminis]GHF30451.1 short-chain dehydrogenase [Kordiimonas sediminis]
MIKTAFITGAASGIGRALAENLANSGVALYLTDVNEAGLKDVQKDLQDRQVNVQIGVLDVSDRAAFEDHAKRAVETIGDIDIVFNNAGVSLSDMVHTGSYEDYHWLMDINFWGVVHGTKAFLDDMLARKTGHIVNISSVFGLVGVPSQSAYCAAKHAVKGFNESLYYELIGTGVQVHSVHPGGIDTNIVVNGRQKQNLSGKVSTDDVQENFKPQAITTPAKAAETIMNGVRKGEYKILIGPDARALDRMSRWFPKLWQKLFYKRATKDIQRAS